MTDSPRWQVAAGYLMYGLDPAAPDTLKGLSDDAYDDLAAAVAERDRLRTELAAAYAVIRRLIPERATDNTHFTNWSLSPNGMDWQDWAELIEDSELMSTEPVTAAEHHAIAQATSKPKQRTSQ